MKNINYNALLLALFILPITTVQSNCVDEGFKESCNSMLGSYIYIKSFDVKHQNKEEESEYSYVFCKGTNYILTVCDKDAEDEKMIVELYDKDKKLVATNYNNKSKKFYTKMGYPCQSTGVYYMKYKFLSGTPACGVSMIGFKKA